MDVLKDMLDLLKCKIYFTTPEGEYEGVVRLVCPVAKKVIIDNAIFLPKRLSMGVLYFHIHEIQSYKLIERPQVDSEKEASALLPIYTDTRPEAILDEYDEGTSVCNSEISEVPEKEYKLELPPKLSLLLPKDSVIIDCIDAEFHQAIGHIKKQDIIGVALEGPKIGRDGVLSWLTISTSFCTFLFDIQVLKETAFQNGLRAIMESSEIEKVFHDCRNPSDCLYHTFNTKIVNVFDTEVADIFITLHYSKGVKSKPQSNTLNSCLRRYLEVPPEFLYNDIQRSYDDNILYYNLRSLRHELRDLLIKNVVYLRLLKKKLNPLLLSPFRRAVEIYLQIVQKATDQELLLEPSLAEGIPPQFELEGIQTVCFKDCVPVPPVVSSGPPYREIRNPIKEYVNYCDEASRGNILDSSSANDLAAQSDEIFYQEHNVPDGDDYDNIKNDFCQDREHNVPNEENFNELMKDLSDEFSQNMEVTFYTNYRRLQIGIDIFDSGNNEKTENGNMTQCETKSVSSGIMENKVDDSSEFLYSGPELFRLRARMSSHTPHFNTDYNDDTLEKLSHRQLNTDCDNTTEKLSPEHSNNDSDNNPWERLRAAFTDIYNTEEKPNEKVKYIPAGMQ